MSYTVVILLIAISITNLLTCEIQVDLFQNFTGDFGINGHDGLNDRSYHVWIIAAANNNSLFLENSSTINHTIYAIALNFSSTSITSCGDQYLYVYKQSFNGSTLLAATFTGNDLLSGSVLIKSSIITVIYHYVGQFIDNAFGFNATYSIKPLLNHMEYRKCTGYYHHIAVYYEAREKMLLHGGIDQQGVLCNGITKVNTYNMNKEYVYWLEGPSGRYLHSGIFINEHLIIYGGKNADKVFGELWKFNANNEQWSELSGNAQMYGHSASLVGDCMIVIGGLNSTSVNSFVLQYNITNDTWYSLETYGGTKPPSIIGHTAVYDSQSNALLVYGGLLLIDMEFIESGSLYSLDMHSLQWSLLHVTSLNAINLIRIFPGSVLINQTLYVFGGLVTNSHDCYSNDILSFLLNSTCGHIPVLSIEGMFPRFGGRATAMKNGTVLLSGGYHSWAYNDIVEFVPPQDLCTILTTLDDCLTVQWCQFCHFVTSSISFCINSNRNDVSHLCDTATVFLPPHCSITTPCSNSQTCSSCWSNDFQQQRDCHWCPCSQECVNSSSMCLEETCFLQHSNSLCYFSQCAVATCDDCARKGCIWTNQLEYVAGITVRVFHQPQHWQCFTSEIVNSISSQLPDNFLFTSINQLEQCHPACSLFTSCLTCARALGDLVGPVGCTWIFETGKCISHIEILLNCPTGSCGMMISDEQLCFDPCDSYSYCHSCLETAYCVWCHQNGSNGEGFCVSPEDTVECLNFNTIPINQECPAENECINGHSSCFPDQQCSDALSGFVCTCPSDYTAGETTCVPVCAGNCSNHGICISPHTCYCDLGYTGNNCSVQCECNGHSNCANESAIGRSICIECLHNTQGEQCEMCKSFFVGSGEDRCISCLEFCHGNSKICIDADLMSNKSQLLHLDLNNVTTNESGLQFNEAICVHCQNNTTGRFCNECVAGYFYQKTAKSFQCIKCPCNGHSGICNITTGLGCDCQNHTATLCPFDGSCLHYQCTSCTEGYVGRPINGMQCYKKLDHNSRYVDSLPANKSSYYFIQPMYSDLDIQVFINIIKGSMDVLVSNSSQTFKITVNSTTWGHNIKWNSNLSGTVMSYFNINERLKLNFLHEEYDLQNEQFYFVLLGEDKETEFTIIFYQVALKLSWFSIISLFLCFFVIIFLSIIMVIYVKRQWNIHRNQRLYNYITNKRLSRPFSKIYVLLNHMMFVEQKDTSTISMFCQKPSSKKSKQTISMVPLSVQPTSDTHSFINTVLIQLPKSSSTISRQINLTTGTYLNCNLNKCDTKLKTTKITPL